MIFETGPCMAILAVPQPIEFEYHGAVPAGFDGVNQTGYSFTKAVKTPTVILTGLPTHTETFTSEKPTNQVPFPLPEGTVFFTAREIMPRANTAEDACNLGRRRRVRCQRPTLGARCRQYS